MSGRYHEHVLVPLAILLSTALTPPELQALDQGQVLTHLEPGDEPVHEAFAEGVVKAPPAKVWALLTDFADYDRVYTGIKRSEVRGRVGNIVLGYFLLDFPWPLPRRWTLNETYLDPAHLTFSWKRIDGTVKRYQGSLHLYPWHQNQTRMVFRAVMDPGLAFVPGWFIDYVSLNTLPAIIQGVRDHVRQEAPSDR